MIRGELDQRERLYAIILLMVYKHPKILFNTSIHSFCRAICLLVSSHLHSAIDPQMVTDLCQKG